MVLAFGLDHITLQAFRTPVAPGGAVTIPGCQRAFPVLLSDSNKEYLESEGTPDVS
jgi:hypothetical protein